jgi:CubicO group peptidase (beta-lactamase class C family)
MQLQEANKLNINDPISNYIPVTLGTPEKPILIHHLMCHSSGISNLSDGLDIRDILPQFTEGIPQIPYTSWEDFFYHVNGSHEYLTVPGTRFHYLNAGYTMLGRIIEVVSEQSLPDFIKENILRPLKMDSSTLLFDDVHSNPDLAQAYMEDTQSDGKLQPTEYIASKFGFAPGGLFSSVKELTNYLIMNMYLGNFEGTQILTPESIEMMQTIQFEESYPSLGFTSSYGKYGENGRIGYGYGWVIHEDFYGHKLVHHSGSYLGASAWLAFIPSKMFGVVFLANKHPSPRILALASLALLLGVNVEEEFPLFRMRRHFSKLTGHYKSYADLNNIIVTEKNSMLFLEGRHVSDVPLLPIGENSITLEYYIPTEIGGRNPAQFEIDEEGTVWFHIERNKWKKIKEI